MLKITAQIETSETIFELEGKPAGPWVRELESCLQRAIVAGQAVRVMLKTVTFIDDAGRNLLGEMHRQGTKLVANGCMTKAIVDEIAAMAVLKRQRP
jgi:hypothetical protein